MLPFISIGIAAGLFFGLLSVAAAGKFYYLICRHREEDLERRNDNNGAWLFCWRKASPVHDDKLSGRREEDVESSAAYGLRVKSLLEEGVEAELMRLHNLCGPPRFLFTIKEETVEDLASEDGKTTSSNRLIDLMRAGDANSISPIASCSPLYFSNGRVNPLFEWSAEAELNKMRSSPPPTFKFMRDAEDKLVKKLETCSPGH